jgi:hypothetical protein
LPFSFITHSKTSAIARLPELQGISRRGTGTYAPHEHFLLGWQE